MLGDPNYRNLKETSKEEMISLNYNHHSRMKLDHQKFVDNKGIKNVEKNDYNSYAKIISHVPNLDNCLELGSASGRQFDVLSTKFKNIQGIDIHKPSIEVGKTLGKNIIESPIEKTPFKNETFDVVVSRHVMEHTYDVEKTLKEIKRILKKNGYVCAVTPHYFPDSEIAHVAQLGINEWIKEYKKAGFQIINAEINRFNCEECHIVAQKIADIKDVYDEMYYKGRTKSGYEDYFKCDYILFKFSEMVNKIFKPESVFDGGCAVGFIPDWFMSHRIKAKGCDISEWATTHSPNIYQADICDIPESDNSFDVVTTMQTLEHIPEDKIEKAVSELYRIAKKYVIICCGMYDTKPLINFEKGDITHTTFWSRKKWTDFIENKLGMTRDEGKENLLNNHDFSKTMTWSGSFIVIKK